MGERKWTAEQISAIETRDRTLLVSAAAGSGKTATLTERIIRSLTDEKNPIDIDSLLVVTFTNAAAAELRQKISDALSEAVKKNPDNRRLERQLFMLPAAKIRTIDSFCGEILRSSADRVGVPPNYRIADTAECELLATSIADGLIEAIFRGEEPDIATPALLDELSDCLTDSGRSDELSEVFRYLRMRCESSERGVESLIPLVEEYNPERYTAAESSRFGAYLIERVHEAAAHYKRVFEKYKLEFESSKSEAEKKYLDTVFLDLSLLSDILGSQTYTELREKMLSLSFAAKAGVRKDKTSAMESYSLLRDMMKEDLRDFVGYFNYTDDQIHELFSGLYRLLGALVRFLLRFDELFLEEKRRRGALSYADIEHYTYKCLVKDGEPTDIAINLRKSFEAIYIDEYQDVNAIQNAIFTAISRKDNRFMVGDIKQSIYGFREAKPEIFADMKEALPPLSESEAGGGASIFMSKNFRCDKGIIDFVNSIFDSAFSYLGKTIGYTKEDSLGYAKLHGTEPEYVKPTVYMLDKPPQKRGDGKATDESEEDTDLSAPAAVAEKIKELIENGKLDSGEAVNPSDIAIVLRTAKNKDRLYADALTARGIPVKIAGAKEFFLSSEVLLALSLLNAIDNPRRDVYLAAVMCSPLFGFSPDELYKIRREAPCDTLYESTVLYSESHPEYGRARDFLSRLAYYRAISEGVSADTLIYKLYRETGLLALATRSGGKDNLMLLYDYSRSWEGGAFRGLYNFISFINALIDKRTAFDQRRDTDSENAVNIVTAHASKGLEYPIVFLVDASAKYTNKDKKNRLAFDSEFGIALRLRSPSGLAIVNNPIHSIINHRIFRKLYEEELRVLYVALTRARERLFVVGRCPTVRREEYLLKMSLIREHMSDYFAMGLSSSLEVILAHSGVVPEYLAEGDSDEVEYTQKCEKSVAMTDEPRDLKDRLLSRFNYKYPSDEATRLPEKLSVSRVCPTVLDGSEGEELFLNEKSDKRARLPAFIAGSAMDESAKRGIATHKVLQFCELENLAVCGVSEELRRLFDEGFISREDLERVRVDELELFRKSTLFEDMRVAKRLYREFRFNAMLPANLFTEDSERAMSLSDEEVLIQGVIDCIVEYPDGSLGLFDYKTDRLTKEELEERTLAEKRLREAHSSQLGYYALAIEKIFGKHPSRVEVYSLPLGDTVPV